MRKKLITVAAVIGGVVLLDKKTGFVQRYVDAHPPKPFLDD